MKTEWSIHSMGLGSVMGINSSDNILILTNENFTSFKPMHNHLFKLKCTVLHTF